MVDLIIVLMRKAFPPVLGGADSSLLRLKT